MSKLNLKSIAGTKLVISVFISSIHAESLTLNSYYPSPIGSFNTLNVSRGANLATISGNVGIGTTNPAGKLHIQSTTPAMTLPTLLITGSNSDLTLVLFSEDTSAGTWRGGIGYFGSNWAVPARRSEIGIANLSNGGGITFLLDNPAASDYSTIDRMRITSSGDVGIGTSAPAEKLHVLANGSGNRGITIENNTTATSSALLRLRNSTSLALILKCGSAAICVGGEGGSLSLLNYENNEPITFATKIPSDVNPVERMRIAADGKVGIGTISPTAELEVDGEIVENGNAVRTTFIRRFSTITGITRDVSCPTGDIAVGGGCSCSTGGRFIGDSYPLESPPTGWHCRCSSSGTTAAYVICAE